MGTNCTRQTEHYQEVYNGAPSMLNPILYGGIAFLQAPRAYLLPIYAYAVRDTAELQYA